MDYMLLGAKSRKTGFQLNKLCGRDKYSMENMDDYFNEEGNESLHINCQSERHKSHDKNILNRSNLSILSPSKINTITSPDNLSDVSRGSASLLIDNIDSQNVVATPLYKGNSSQAKSISDITSFQSNYNISEIIEEEETEEEEEGQIQRNVPDLLEDSEREYNTTEESALLDTSQDALLESELASKIYNKTVKNTNTYSNNNSDEEDNDYILIENEGIERTKPKAPIRRSTRIKVPTLDYWRNEKIVYKRRSAKPELDIFKIITYENENNNSEKKNDKKRNKASMDNKPYNRQNFPSPMENNLKRRKRIKLNSSCLNGKMQDSISTSGKKNIEWVSRGVFEGIINEKSIMENNLKSKREILAVARNYIDNEKTYYQDDNNYKINILFDSQKDHFATGFMTLPINGQKSLSTIDNIYIIFHVLKGCVEVSISKNNKFACMEGSTFQIPSYNSYSLSNKGNTEVKLYFVQVTIK